MDLKCNEEFGFYLGMEGSLIRLSSESGSEWSIISHFLDMIIIDDIEHLVDLN